MWPRGSNHLVTRAEMMSVMVALTSASISSTGPGMGSCWQRCSALRICCRFCQMISASFSHLHTSPKANGKDNGFTSSSTPEVGRLPVWGTPSPRKPSPGRPYTLATSPIAEQWSCPADQKHRETRRRDDPDSDASITLHSPLCPTPHTVPPSRGRRHDWGAPKSVSGTSTTGEIRPVTGQSEWLHMETQAQKRQLVAPP